MSNEKEKLRDTPTYNCQNKNKIPRNYITRINLTKEVKDLQTKNYKTLMKEAEDDTNKWEDILCS